VSVPKQAVAAVVAAVVALLLSGCGTAGPGTAVKIGDQSLTTSDVDQLASGFCDALRPQLQSNGAVYPMSFVRAYVVRNLTVRAAAQQLADQYAVTLPASYDQAVRDLRTQLTGIPEDKLDLAVEVESVRSYVRAVELEVGRQLLAQAGTTGADDSARQLRGQDALEQWMSEHPADVNPLYGIKVTGTGLDAPDLIDTGSTYALSANAVAAEKTSSSAGPDPAYAASLPSSQRCG
jgi:hypothetical protein